MYGDKAMPTTLAAVGQGVPSAREYADAKVAADIPTLARAGSESEMTLKIACHLENALSELLSRLEGESPTAQGAAIGQHPDRPRGTSFGGHLGMIETSMTETRMTLDRCHQLVGRISRHA